MQPMKDPEGLTANITSERPMQRSSVTAESVSPRENQPSPLDLDLDLHMSHQSLQLLEGTGT